MAGAWIKAGSSINVVVRLVVFQKWKKYIFWRAVRNLTDWTSVGGWLGRFLRTFKGHKRAVMAVCVWTQNHRGLGHKISCSGGHRNDRFHRVRHRNGVVVRDQRVFSFFRVLLQPPLTVPSLSVCVFFSFTRLWPLSLTLNTLRFHYFAAERVHVIWQQFLVLSFN